MARSPRRRSSGGRRTARSAISGRYVRAATAARRPRTTVVSTARRGRRSSTVRYRSAISGRYVRAATAARHPHTTISTHR